MRFSLIFLMASAGLAAAQATNTTDAAGQCIETCFNKVGDDNPDSPDIARCTSISDGLLQLLCLCDATPLVDAFTACAGQTCPDLTAQLNGTEICKRAAASASSTGPSNTASGAGSQAPAPSSGANDEGNGAGGQRATILSIVVGGAAVVFASGLLI